jgi:hypothetical protein
MTVCSVHHCIIVFVFLISLAKVAGKSPKSSVFQELAVHKLQLWPGLTRPYRTLSPQRNFCSCFSFYSSFNDMKTFNFIFVNQHPLLRTSQFKKIQQKILYALVRIMNLEI